jgi:hypothetical protein
MKFVAKANGDKDAIEILTAIQTELARLCAENKRLQELLREGIECAENDQDAVALQHWSQDAKAALSPEKE